MLDLLRDPSSSKHHRQSPVVRGRGRGSVLPSACQNRSSCRPDPSALPAICSLESACDGTGESPGSARSTRQFSDDRLKQCGDRDRVIDLVEYRNAKLQRRKTDVVAGPTDLLTVIDAARTYQQTT